MISSTKKVFATMGTVLMLLLVVFSAGCISNTTITYYVDGTQWYKTDLISFVTGDEPQDPVKDGYAFGGWYFDRGTWNEPLTKTVDGKLTGSEKVSVYAYFVGIDDSAPSKDDKVTNEDNPEDGAKTMKAISYSSSYTVTPLDNEFGAAYYSPNNGKLYVEYYIAKIDGAIVDVLTPAIQNPGTGSTTVGYESFNTKESTEHLEEMVSSVNGGDDHFSWSIDAEIDADIIKDILGIKVKGSVSSIDNRYWETNTITKSSSSNLESSTRAESFESTFVWSDYEPGLWYQYVAVGDYFVKQVYVCDLKNGETETFCSVELIPSTEDKIALLSSINGDYDVPQTDNLMMDSVDLSDLLDGDGTAENPFHIYSKDDFMLMQFDEVGQYSYELMNIIELDDADWFNPELFNKFSNFETGEYAIYGNGEKYPKIIHPIWNVDDFENIGLNPSWDYILMADIDFTDITESSRVEERCIVDVEFTGILDGNGKTITGNSKNLNLEEHSMKKTGRTIVFDSREYDSDQYYGLFKKNSGTIKDLTLCKFRILGEEECHKGKFAYVGCIAGENQGTISNVVLKDCWIECFRTNSIVGAVAGKNSGTIEEVKVLQCYVYGNGKAGGIVGVNDNVIKHCDVVGSGSEVNYYKRFLYVNQRRAVELSWGGIAGEATENSRITDVSIQDALIVSRFQYWEKEGVSTKCNVGYIVGKNAGNIYGYTIDHVNNLVNTKNVFLMDEFPDAVVNSYFMYKDGVIGESVSGIVEKEV